jgi:hypothetical protein
MNPQQQKSESFPIADQEKNDHVGDTFRAAEEIAVTKKMQVSHLTLSFPVINLIEE